MYICIYAYTKQVGSFVTILQRIESIWIISYSYYAYRRICVFISTDNAPTNKYYFVLFFFFFSVQLFIIYHFVVFVSRVTYPLREFASLHTYVYSFLSQISDASYFIYYTCILVCKCCICIAYIRRCTRRKATLVDTSCIYNEMRVKFS